MKYARIRIQIDVELDSPIDGFNLEDPDHFEHVRFFFEENHCVENETRRALELLGECGDLASARARRKYPKMPESSGVCVTCHGAGVKLLGIVERDE